MGRSKTFFQACEDGDSEKVEDLLRAGFKVDALHQIEGYTGLHYASDSGNLAVVQLLLTKYKADVNKVGPDGASALHWATRTPKREDVIKCLLRYGADPNIQGKYGRAPIHVCASKGLTSNLDALVHSSKSINMNLTDNLKDKQKGTTALHLAAANGHEECVRALLYQFDNTPDTWARNSKRQLPLHLACTQSNVKIVDMLISASTGACAGKFDDLSAIDSDGKTPLLYACLYKNTGVVKFLTELGKSNNTAVNRCININFSNSIGETALHCAAAGGMEDIIHLLVAGKADKTATTRTGLTPLHLACQNGHFLASQALVKYSVDIESKDTTGETPLMSACEHGHADIVEMLVRNGANIAARDHAGETPVFCAVKENRVDVVKYLMSLIKGDTTLYSDVDNAHNTPLHAAARAGYHACLELLLEKGYNLKKMNNTGYTAVHLAAKEGRNETLQKIVDWDSKSHSLEDKHFNTPLHVAAQHGQTLCCRMLISSGAAVNKHNIRGVTPLHLGAESGSKSVCHVLLDNGADVNAVDVNEETALHYSARCGEEATSRVLILNNSSLSHYSEQGENPLLLAIRNNNENVIAVIIMSERWKEALKLNEEDERDHGILDKSDVILKILEDRQDRQVDTDQVISNNPLHQLIIHYPEQARAIFDRCTTADDMISEENANYWVQFDYSLIESGAEGVVHPFTTMLQHNRITLLDHPLISSLITYKWQTYGRHSFLYNVVLNLVFLMFITAYALLETPPDSPQDMRPATYLTVLAVGVIVFSVIRLVLELLQAIRNTKDYFSDPVNYMEVFVFIFSIVFVSSIFEGAGNLPSYFQWELGCLITVMAWVNMIMSLKKLPYIGIYVIMMKINVKSFLKVLLSFFMFLFPFALVFHMSLGSTFGTFRQPGYALSKTLIMFLGEINYDMYFVPPSLEAENPVKYPFSTYILFHVFVFCLPIILMNLLIGLAVDDVSETLRTAKLIRSAQRIEQIFLTEKLMIYSLPKLTYPCGRLYPNKLSWRMSTGYDFKGTHIMEILARRRTKRRSDRSGLGKLQQQMSSILSNQVQLKAKLSVIYSMLEEKDPDLIRTSNSRIIDRE